MNTTTRLSTLLLSTATFVAVACGTSLAADENSLQHRLAQLERENATLTRENAALRLNRKLARENVALRKSSSERAAPATAPSPGTSVRDAYAADFPVAYKALPVETQGQFRFWGEGGAIWSGGDPVTTPYSLRDFSSDLNLGFGAAGGPPNRLFNLTPKVGWEAAAGFDYRFAGSPWHVSGEFRYGQARGSGADASAGSVAPEIMALFPLPLAGAAIGGSQTIAASHREDRWQADIALGYDALGGPSHAMQIKGGLRIAELVGRTTLIDRGRAYMRFPAPVDIGLGIPIQSIDTSTASTLNQRSSFFGAGPRVGVEGFVPLGGGWAFDYLGDAAILFGSQKLTSTSTVTTTISPAFLAILAGGGTNTATTVRDQRFAAVFNTDLQLGVSYWINPNVRISASYRLDAYFNAFSATFDPNIKDTISRYIHGPRLRVTAQF